MKTRVVYSTLAFLLAFGLSLRAAPPSLLTGTWRGVIETQGKEIPFNFLVEKKSLYDYDIYLHNGDEKLLIPNVRLKGDSVYIEMPVLESEIRAVAVGRALVGEWVKHHPTRGYSLPFRAAYARLYRFDPPKEKPAADLSGKWEVTFTDKDGKTTPAIGVFRQQDERVTGSFLTPTGDYRYLEGQVEGNLFRLSTFDGGFAYLFEATRQADGSLKGEFRSGKSGYQTWTARLNENAKLPDPNTATTLKPGTETMAFTFPGLDGKLVSLQDERFKNKVVVVQLLGSWCPNCLDETAFLAPWYQANRRRGVEVVGLAYEYSPEFAKAKARVERLQQRFKVEYPLLIAGTPGAEAAKTLPMLNGINAYPTTIFIDRKGKVRKIHTGFSGPGTGEYYQEYIEEFNRTVDELVKEK